VRQAIVHAIDRQGLVDRLAGLGEVASGGLFPPSSPYWQGPDEGFPQRFFDQEKAKALLAEAGFGDGFDITIHAADAPPTRTVGRAVEANLKAVGIRATLRLSPVDAWLQATRDDPTALVVGRGGLPCPHGSYLVDSAFLASTLQAFASSVPSPDVVALAAEARATPDTQRQLELYRQLDRLLSGDQLLWVPLYYPRYAAFVGQRVRGFFVPGSPSGGAKHLGRYAVQA
jgi:ABC-type transport system substrate-binding protein